MKIALIGSTGLFGHDLAHCLTQRGHTVHAFHSKTLDITRPISQDLGKPDFLINCAAYTKVDLCETEQALAFQLNAQGPRHLAHYCHTHSIPMIHFSTDYIFDGAKTTPYLETDLPAPLSVYGHSKLAGETAIQETLSQFYIFRIQWLYGQNGPHFVKTILTLAQTRPELHVVNDQWGSPSWTADLALRVTLVLEHRAPYGIYHLANEGYTTWHAFAQKICELKDMSTPILPQSSHDSARPAQRPLNGRLHIQKFLDLGLGHPLSWETALETYLKGDFA